jgi:methylglutaconyl-CoA hydratase
MTRIRLEQAGPLARVILARPEKRNALDRQAADELRGAFTALNESPACRVIMLTAEGVDFCAGADLGALAALAGADRAAHRADASALGEVFTTIRALDKPVIGAVRGRALGGGAGLATACDLVIAGDDARFGYPEVTVGFVPAMVMTMLRRCVGEKRAFELVVTGRTVAAAEALQLGLASRVVPSAELETEAVALATQIARSSPAALRLTKRLFYELDGTSFSGGIARGADVNAEARDTAEFRAGIERFLARQRDAETR